MIDREGAIPVEAMRSHFEAAIKSTPLLAKNTHLGVMEINGKFSHYVEPDTDTMWIGFALGMRCAERAAKSRQNDQGSGAAGAEIRINQQGNFPPLPVSNC